MIDLEQLDICFIAGTLGQGGAERQLYYMIRTLKAAGAHVRVLCLTQGEFWEQPIADLGVTIEWVGSSASRVRRLLAMLRILRSRAPAVIQSAHFYTNIYAAALGALLQVGSIGALRNDGVSELRATGRVFGWLSMRLPPMLVANSALGMRNARAIGVPERRLRFLPNVVDTSIFSPNEQPTNARLTMLYLGRLEPQKRVDRFIRIVARLHDAGYNELRAVIVGAGALRAKLEQQANNAGLLPEVLEFRGSMVDTSRAYQQADILALTSDWEGTPNVVLEAMACGLPVVATRVGGVPDIVCDGETGYFVEPENEDLFFTRICSLIEDPELREQIGQRANTYILAHHSLAALPKLLAEIYDEVCNDVLGLAAGQR